MPALRRMISRKVPWQRCTMMNDSLLYLRWVPGVEFLKIGRREEGTPSGAPLSSRTRARAGFGTMRKERGFRLNIYPGLRHSGSLIRPWTSFRPIYSCHFTARDHREQIVFSTARYSIPIDEARHTTQSLPFDFCTSIHSCLRC